MYCCGSLYSIFIGETITAVEENNLFYFYFIAVAAVSCLKFRLRMAMYKFVNNDDNDAGQSRHCICLLCQIMFCNFILFDLF